MSTDITSLIRLRAGKRQSITKTVAALDETFPTDLGAVDFYINKLTNIRSELLDLDSNIVSIRSKEEKFGEDLYLKFIEENETYLDKVDLTVSRLKEKRLSLIPVGVLPSENPDRSQGTSTPKLQLPQLELPAFDGKPVEFSRFIECFESILNKFCLSDFEKFSYLLQQVSGPARDIVNSVPQDNLSYETAKSLLTDAFSCKITQQFQVIEKLSQLKFGSVSDFYRWVSNVRIVTDQINNLDITPNIFIQYFIWNGIPAKFKSTFMNITNESYPSIDQIIGSAFKVHDRIKETSVKAEILTTSFVSGMDEESVTMATAVNTRSVAKQTPNAMCQLCHADDSPDSDSHKIWDCETYKTPQSKLNKIQQLKGCTRCGLLNHDVSSCNFRFHNKCYNCKTFHQSFLCVENIAQEKSFVKNGSRHGTNKNSEKIGGSSNPVTVNVMTNSIGNHTVIPTFTLTLPKKNGYLDVRSMYDPASQVSFITQKFLQQVKHKIVKESVEVQITGFNDVKLLKTKIVEISVNLGGETRIFEAIVVPKLNSYIKSPLFKQVEEAFKEAEIPLADKYLSSDNGAIGILLGIDFAHILPIQSCSFGSEVKSLVYHTCTGIMISGNIESLVHNIPYLEVVKETFNKMIHGM